MNNPEQTSKRMRIPLDRPKVGVVVLISKDERVLLGRRLSNDGTLGMFGAPGGHVEYLESLVETAHRETLEETGMEIENIRFVGVINVRELAPLHFVMIVLRADWKSGDPQTCEPDRCEGWNWYTLDALPEPMTPATGKGIGAMMNGEMMLE